MASANVVAGPWTRRRPKRSPILRRNDPTPEGVARFSEAWARRRHEQEVAQVEEAGVRRTPELLILLAIFEQLDHEQRHAAHCRIASYCRDPETGWIASAALTLLGR